MLYLNSRFCQKINSSDIVVHDEFEKRNIEAAEFSKKLMGQIVFLYFLQEKRWLGVKVGEKWGDWSKRLYEATL